MKYSSVIKYMVVVFAFFLLADAGLAKSAKGIAKRGDKLYHDEKYDEALQNYDEALAIKPDDPAINYNRAITLYRKGQFSEAEEAFLRSLASGEEKLEEEAVYNAGNSRYREGETAERTNPQNALKNYSQAVEYYKRAMEVEPDDMDAKYNYEYTLK
ncbi:tetratricopeptide repeat protein, partial [Candidatus Omnitrophota bacterium]